MSKQPEALRLADWLEETIPEFPEPTRLESEAAKELRRLHAANVELVGNLKHIMSWIGNWDPEFTNDPDWPDARDRARAAIAKHGSKS